MNNVTLGRALKAMYKLSGKTLPQLSEETGLTVDTINNLFYARIQKPGLAGVNALVHSMGFTLLQLMTFLDDNPDISDDCDVTDLFTKYISDAEDTNESAVHTSETADSTKNALPAEIELINEEHQRQLDRFRATHQRYSAQLQEQHDRQIEQMQEHTRQLEQHFDRSLLTLKETHAREIERMEKESRSQKRIIRILAIAAGIETISILMLLISDMIIRTVGWIR